jgi:hypothetical protein
MDITADEDFPAVGDRKGGEANSNSHPVSAGTSAAERARAAMARYESYIAGYRAWARNLRRPSN